MSPTTPVGVTVEGWGWRHSSRLAWAVRGLDLRIEPGERVLLLGESGAGKSTLLHALAGVVGDDEGETEGSLLVAGEHPAAHRGRTGLVIQDPDSQVILERVGDDVAFGCENLGVPRDEIWIRVRDSLASVGLEVALDRNTSALSGGQKQRLALAGVLAMRPGLIVLDEPTANLDPEGVTEVRDAVIRVAESTGATIVVVEHRVSVWSDVVDRIVVLAAGGGVIADGVPADVLARQGKELAARGVWIPQYPPPRPVRAVRAPQHTLLSARQLTVGRSKNALGAPLDLEILSSHALAITGPNGAGKSTLALTLGGLLPPVGGAVEASPALASGAGEHPIRWKSRELLTRIGTVFQDPEHQLLTSTVRAELEVGPRALKLPDSEVDVRVDELLTRLRLDRLAEANPFTLSGGEKRRLSVATALATRPQVLVLDEPTFGQDSRTWSELLALLARLVDDGSSVIAVSHDLDFVAALADATVALE
ncbi:ABC transporter ATP-binding protein [Salinibacterium sp. NK8237]|uniref:ABC transporter ATP-binding protein n=1 Tax=Salinibacterium sp. NK8237 TaxID=2792038 RepID=UPI0018CCB9FF|nr:ATP-binding cassette domain-containing protein [Salinibacterium sp. NK8237]MBH0129395.1 ATP-binding cassette domain-containing protein [Salinibacterium sp. NK8237]